MIIPATVFWLIASLPAWSQKTATVALPRAAFSQDTVKIGEPVVFSLSYIHDVGQQVLFPDTTYSFAPFELISKKYFDTRLSANGKQAIDSAAYTLAAFELDTLQSLRLPVFVIAASGDSIPVYANPDQVTINFVIETVPDSVVLEEEAEFTNVPLEFNYPYWFFGAGVLLLLAIISFILFRKKAGKAFQSYKIKKQYLRFEQKYSKLSQEAISNRKPENTAAVVAFWKQYLQNLTGSPYTSYTSRQVTERIDETNNGAASQALKQALLQADRHIYGNRAGQLPASFEQLKQTATALYQQRKETVQHG